jgi:hypothetical protein
MTRNAKATKAATTTKATKATKATFSPALQELMDMHTYCRPAGSKTEAAFCAAYIDTLPGVEIDGYNNRIVQVGDKPTVLWSSHTDTVHRKGGFQAIAYGDGVLSLTKSSMATSSCLGADCTAGVWLMRQMILRKVPGLYIFHAEEEIGGGGSNFIATKTPQLLTGIDHAIAFDRRGDSSIITHQGGRCASNGFATALGDALTGQDKAGYTYQFTPDSTGTFTDTANYTHLIPECTNISVGYYKAHTPGEYLDVRFLVYLLGKLCSLDTTKLPVLRDPKEFDVFNYRTSTSRYSSYTTHNHWDTLADLVYDNPDATATLLEALGVTADQLRDYINNIR